MIAWERPRRIFQFSIKKPFRKPGNYSNFFLARPAPPCYLLCMTPLETELTDALAASQQQNAELRQEIDLLKQKINALVRRIFGAKSEQLNPAQLELLLTGMEGPPPPGKSDASRVASAGDTLGAGPVDHTIRLVKPARRPRLPEHLPVVEEIIDPEPVKQDPQGWRCIGQEVTGQLDYTPGRFFRRHLIRRKYVRKHQPEAPPIIAPLTTLQDACLAAPGLLAAIIVGKYCDHLPLYRQEQIFKTRHQIALPRQTMVRWLAMAADWLKPLWKTIKTTVMEDGYVQVDETVIKYLAPGHGKTKTGYLWPVHRPGGDTIFHWFTSRAAVCLDEIFPEKWEGILQCDGYAAYPAFANKNDGRIRLGSCMAHIRRDFYDALAEAPIRAGWLLRQIQHLYQIEKTLRQPNAHGKKSSAKTRQRLRQVQAVPILRRMKNALLRFKASGRHLPKSAFGQALNYALGQWDGLTCYLEDGRVELDNNLIENAIRPCAIGKKNYLFIGDAEAGETTAIYYTLIESARRRGLDPQAYLHDILRRRPITPLDQIHTLTPAAWAKAQQKKAA